MFRSKALKLSGPKLRRIIKEEISKLNEEFTYTKKLEHLQKALAALRDAQKHEEESDVGKDPDLDSIVEDLEGLIDAVIDIQLYLRPVRRRTVSASQD